MVQIVEPVVAPALRSLLVPIMRVTGFNVANGMIFLASAIAAGLFGAAEHGLGWIPWVGPAIKGSIHSIEQRLSHYLGRASAGVDTQVGVALHQLGGLTRFGADEIRGNAGLLLVLANVTAHPLSLSAWRAILPGVHKSLVGAAASLGLLTLRLSGVETQLHHPLSGRIGAAIHTVTRPIVGELHGLERWTYPKVKALEHEVGVAIPADIAGLRAGARAIEDGLAAAWAKIRAHEAALAGTAIAGAVAIALEALGASWIRCRNWNRIGRSVCGTGATDIEALLGLLAAGATIASFRELVQLGQQVEHGVAVVLQDVAKL